MINLIKAGLFSKVPLANPLNDSVKSTVYKIAYDENITSYAFASYLIFKYKSSKNHFYASNIIFGYFAFINGSSAMGYQHFTHVLNDDPTNKSLSEYQLIFYEVPDEVFSPKEARLIAKEILLLNQECEIALDCFTRTETFEDKPLTPLGNGLSTYERVQLFIEKGRFPLAFNEISNMSHDELLTILKNISSEKNITAYGFVWAMINQQETAMLHLLAAQFFRIDFNHLNGAPAVVFSHTHKAAEIEPDNLEIQEQLLSLYEPGNESFDLEETKKLVERVLKMNPQSTQVLRVKLLLE